MSRVSTPPTSTANHSHQIIQKKKHIESQLSVHFIEAYSRLPPTQGANSTPQHDDPLDTSTINPVCTYDDYIYICMLVIIQPGKLVLGPPFHFLAQRLYFPRTRTDHLYVPGISKLRLCMSWRPKKIYGMYGIVRNVYICIYVYRMCIYVYIYMTSYVYIYI